ncbi:MAG: hypothetical protein EAX95_09145 [Candidatus Thorarchaeota archaeon]|nr:hypothetical protein [Candidatus Thorarchaeota archaeon]
MNKSDADYYILDLSRVRVFQAVLLICSVSGFFLYALFLNYLCAYGIEPISVLPLVSIQIGVGVVVTRLFQVWGASSALKVALVDANRLPASWIPTTVGVTLASLNKMFDQLIARVSDNRPEADDVTDFAWFGIIVWAVVSSAAKALFNYSSLVCISAAGVLAICSIICYYNGYRSRAGTDFDEDLEHLRYYLVRRLSEIDSRFSAKHQSFQVHLLGDRNRVTLSDVGISLEPSGKRNRRVTYWIGLSSNRPEAIDVTAPDETDINIEAILRKIPVLQNPAWILKKLSSGLYQIANDTDVISISEPSSYVPRATKPILGVEDIVSSMKMICIEIGILSVSN